MARDEPANVRGELAEIAADETFARRDVVLDRRDDRTDQPDDSPTAGPHDSPTADPDDSPTGGGVEDRERPRFGAPGRPLRQTSPFYIGFVGGLGLLLAWYLAQAVVGARQVIILIVVSLFLAVGLNPIVERLMRRGLSRRLAVLTVAIGLLVVFGGFIAAIAPPLTKQTSDLINSLPASLAQLRDNPRIQDLDAQYHIIQKATDFLTGPDLATTVFGGALGIGWFVLSGLFSAFTVLILTLYFLGSLPSIKEQAYLLAPRTRRERVRLLSDEVLARIGGYVDGALTIALVAGFSTFVFLEILGLKYALTLALVVAVFDLIPMIGATVGAAVVCTVALFDSGLRALICVAFYLAYQQIENYLLYPRVMKRSVDVPPAVTVIAALFGGTMLGVVGALIAIPTAAAVLLIIREVVVPRQASL